MASSPSFSGISGLGLPLLKRLVILPLIGLGLGIATAYERHGLIASYGRSVCPGSRNLHHVLRDLRTGLRIVRCLVSLSTLLSILTMPVIIVADDSVSALNLPLSIEKPKLRTVGPRLRLFLCLIPLSDRKTPASFPARCPLWNNGDTAQHPAFPFPAQLGKGIAAVFCARSARNASSSRRYTCSSYHSGSEQIRCPHPSRC